MNIAFPGSRGEGRLSRDVWLVCLASGFGAASSLGMRNVIMSLYVLRLGYGPEFVGTVFATGALCFALSGIPAGTVGSRLGLKRTMILGNLFSALSIGLLPLTEVLPQPLAGLWPAIVQGMAAGGWCFFVVNVVATLAALTGTRNRANAYAMHEASAGMGSFLGALLAGALPGILASLLSQSMDTAVPFRQANWASVFLSLLTIVPLLLLRAVPKVERAKGQAATPFRFTLPLALVALVAMLNNACFASCKAFSPAYLDQVFHLPAATIGAVTSVGLLLSVVGALGGGKVARKLGNTRAMALASCVVAASVAVMAIWPNWVATSLGLIGVFGVMGMWRPSFASLQMEIAQPEWRALVSGLTAMGMSMGFSSMSFGGGYLVTAYGYPSIYLLGAGLALASATVATVLGRVMAARQTAGAA